MRTAKNLPKCTACEKKIRDNEPDVVLQRIDSAERGAIYHTRCARGALAMTMLEPGVWHVVVRHVDEELN